MFFSKWFLPQSTLLEPLAFSKIIFEQKDSIIEHFHQKVPDAYLKDFLPLILDEVVSFLTTSTSKKNESQTRNLKATHTLTDIRREFSILRELIMERLPQKYSLANQTANLFVQICELNLSHAMEEFTFNKEIMLAREKQALAEDQNKWLHEMLNRLPKPLFLMDPAAKKVIFSNKAAEDMLGVSYTETNPTQSYYGKVITATDFNGRPLAPEETASFRTLNGEELHGDEYKVHSTTGTFYLKAYSAQLPALYGKPASAVLLIQDVTALKNAETTLKKAELELNQAIQVAKIGFWHLSLPSNSLKVSPLLLDHFGLSAETFNGTLDETLQIIHPEDRDTVLAAIEQSVYHKAPFHSEYRVIHPDGNVLWIEARGEVSYDHQGVAIGFTGSSLNITERLKAQEQIEQRALEFIELADSMPQIVWTANPAGDLDYFNQVWFDYSGTNYEENVGGGWTQSVHPIDMPLTLERWTHSIKNGEVYENEFRLLSKNGDYRWFVARSIPVRDSKGRIRKWYGTNTDIHDQKILSDQLLLTKDRAESANAAKSQFLANMSHEIRTPLGAVMGFVSLLKDESLTRAEQQSFLSVIERNSSQLLRIIDDILDLSKVEAGMMLIEEVHFSMPELLTDFSSLMGLKAREKGISFYLKAITPIPETLNSDPTRLRQILMNVVGNAIKFTDQGRVELNISYKDHLLIFEVSDTGRGISEEQEKNLFQPFSQADASTTRKYGGTGLGLALTRRLAENFGGSFDLKTSQLGKGSTFVVSMKVKVPSKVDFITGLDFESKPARTAVPLGKLAGVKILLVEDSPDNQALISIFLGRVGARIDIASDGEQGCQMALTGHYDIILMDVQMPVMDGIAAVKNLRKSDYRKPIVALTAHAMKEERIRCLEAGFDHFLSKPIVREELIETLVTITTSPKQ